MPLHHRARIFSMGLLWGSVLGTLLGMSGLFLLFSRESLGIAVPGWTALDAALLWVGSNMGSSLLPFAVVLLLYGRGLSRLKNLLNAEGVRPELIGQAEHWLEILESLTFGIGVLWTAIGMRAALLGALGDVASHSAAGAPADILARLVDGGILVALSTTIVGGAAGYLMRVIKSTQIGLALRRFYERRDTEQADVLLAALARIEGHLSARAATKSDSMVQP